MMHGSIPAGRKGPLDHYVTGDLSARLETADPHGLVAILYAELVLSLEALAAAMARGPVAPSHRQVDRARSILISLEVGLDAKGGGDLAMSLAQIYRAMRKELTLAIAAGDAEAVRSLADGAISLRDAWAAITR